MQPDDGTQTTWERIERENVARIVVVSALKKLPDLAAAVRLLSAIRREIAPHSRLQALTLETQQLPLRLVPPPDVAPAPPVAEPEPAAPATTHRAPRAPTKRRYSKIPRTIALDETVAIAMREGRIGNEHVRNKMMICASAADMRLRAAHDAGRLERVDHGQYEASPAEYVRIGLDPAKKGRELGMSFRPLADKITAAREAAEASPERAPA